METENKTPEAAETPVEALAEEKSIEAEAPKAEAPAEAEGSEVRGEQTVAENKAIDIEAEVSAESAAEAPIEAPAAACAAPTDPLALAITNAFSVVAKALEAVNATMATLIEQQKALPVKGQAAPDGQVSEADEKADLVAKIASLEAQIAELSVPVNRNGEIPTETLPSEEAPEAAPVAEEKPKSLRDAVAKFVETKKH